MYREDLLRPNSVFLEQIVIYSRRRIMAPVRSTNPKDSTECRVCSGPALYSYVGVVVCASCKMFFKRKAEKPKVRKCLNDGLCSINRETRRNCNSCRLNKCFAMGMQIELLRPAYAKSRWSMTTDQKALLHSLTEQSSSRSNLIELFRRHQYELPSKIRFKLPVVEELFRKIIFNSRESFESNTFFCSLTSNDQSILLETTMKKILLLRCCCIIFKSNLIRDPILFETLKVMFGQQTLEKLVEATQLLHSDRIFLELVFHILLFSNEFEPCETTARLHDVRSVLNIQHIHMDLVCRYLHSNNDHRQTIICFSNLIRSLFLFHRISIRFNNIFSLA